MLNAVVGPVKTVASRPLTSRSLHHLSATRDDPTTTLLSASASPAATSALSRSHVPRTLTLPRHAPLSASAHKGSLNGLQIQKRLLTTTPAKHSSGEPWVQPHPYPYTSCQECSSSLSPAIAYEAARSTLLREIRRDREEEQQRAAEGTTSVNIYGTIITVALSSGMAYFILWDRMGLLEKKLEEKLEKVKTEKRGY
ncbi:MAG: hypothetical protein Q9160_006915 [Pyrenula sp. 1 TL-2023]